MTSDDERFAVISARLYALPPEKFVEARNAEAKQTATGLGRAIRALRRPTLSAWLVNLLAAHRSDDLGELLDLGEQLRNAQRALEGDELRSLSARRHAVVNSLVGLAEELAGERGRTVRDATVREVESTLRAALADPHVAADVAAGTVVKPAEYSGLGAPPEPPDAAGDDPDASAEPARDRRAPGRNGKRAALRVIQGGRSEDAGTADGGRPGRPRRSAALRDESRANTATERTQRALVDAERDLESATTAERDATRRLKELATEIDELRQRERRLRDEQAELDRDRRRAERRRRAAEKSIADARRRSGDRSSR